MSAAMRSGVIVEKFKTIEKNFATTAANCARIGVSLDKICATAAGRGEIEHAPPRVGERQGGVSKGPKRTENKINESFTAIVISVMCR